MVDLPAAGGADQAHALAGADVKLSLSKIVGQSG